MARKTVAKPAKKPEASKQLPSYNAAGLARRGVLDVVNGEEYKRMGFKDYPWPVKTKADMVEACNGLSSLAEIMARIKELSPNA